MLEKFLKHEADYKDMAEVILQFINSYEIRSGELEGNVFVVKKIDRGNFIVYEELVDQKGNKSVLNAFAIYRKDLQQAIVKKAKECGYELNKELLRD
jgi:predicted lactoylglutathione lyase